MQIVDFPLARVATAIPRWSASNEAGDSVPVGREKYRDSISKLATPLRRAYC